MKIKLLIMFIVATLSQAVNARTLLIYGNIQNQLKTTAIVHLCATSELPLKSMDNCPKDMLKRLELKPGETKKVEFIVHWGGYKLLWKLISPIKQANKRSGTTEFEKGVANVVLEPSKA